MEPNHLTEYLWLVLHTQKRYSTGVANLPVARPHAKHPSNRRSSPISLKLAQRKRRKLRELTANDGVKLSWAPSWTCGLGMS